MTFSIINFDQHSKDVSKLSKERITINLSRLRKEPSNILLQGYLDPLASDKSELRLDYWEPWKLLELLRTLETESHCNLLHHSSQLVMWKMRFFVKAWLEPNKQSTWELKIVAIFCIVHPSQPIPEDKTSWGANGKVNFGGLEVNGIFWHFLDNVISFNLFKLVPFLENSVSMNWMVFEAVLCTFTSSTFVSLDLVLVFTSTWRNSFCLLLEPWSQN